MARNVGRVGPLWNSWIRPGRQRADQLVAWRSLLLAWAWVVMPLAGPSAVVIAQGGPASPPGTTLPAEVSVAPANLPVSEGVPAEVTIHLSGGPSSGTFDLTLRYDPMVVVPTAVRFGEPGSPAAGKGKPSFVGTGQLRLEGPFDTTANTSLPPTLATVTFAPVAAGTSSIGVEAAGLLGPDRAAVNNLTTGATLATVVASPSTVSIEAALKQSEALTSTQGSSLVPSLGGLADSLTSTLRVKGWTLFWLGLMLTASAVVGIGWLVGRPKVSMGPSASQVRWTHDDDSAAPGQGPASGPMVRKP